jgi:hypothetical protein
MSQSDEDENPTLQLVLNACLVLSLVSIGLSVRLILRHLRHFSQPIIQRKIISIVWMVPVYATTSWLSLRFVRYSIYTDILRDCYESYVIYMFFALCYCYIGQLSRNSIDRDRIHAVLAAKGSINHLLIFPSCMGIPKEINLAENPRGFLFACKKYILQFVLIKPMSAIAVFILTYYFDNYEVGNFSPSNGYLYITTIVNVSISFSLYWLVMFYQATKESLMPFNPVPKFLCIKGVLFFSYWQSVIVTILVKLGIITEIPVIHYSVEHVASTVQNSLICLEMVGFAIAHHYAFSADPFYYLPTRLNSDLPISQPLVADERTSQPRPPMRTSARAMIRNAVDFSDVVSDLQEVAPDMPIVRYLRRNSSSSVPADSHLIIPSTEGINQVRDTKQPPPRPSP